MIPTEDAGVIEGPGGSVWYVPADEFDELLAWLDDDDSD